MKLLFCVLATNYPSISLADIIVLSSGERLEVTIVEENADSVLASHPILGELNIAIKNIQTIDRTTPIPATLARASEEESVIPSTEVKWNQNIKLGAGYQSGQTDNSDLSTSYHADRTVEEHEVIFDLSYRFAKTNSDRSANRFSGAWGNKWFQAKSKWDFFTNLQFDWGEFQSWDQRIVGDLGIGYEIYTFEDSKETASLSSRFGGGVRKEFQSENENIIPEGLLGLSFDWKLTGLQTFNVDTTWHPDFEDFANYRLVTRASWNIKMTEAKNLDFSIGLHHEYDSVVDVDVKNTYLHLTAGITYSF